MLRRWKSEILKYIINNEVNKTGAHHLKTPSFPVFFSAKEAAGNLAEKSPGYEVA